jgi:hypothetical protein
MFAKKTRIYGIALQGLWSGAAAFAAAWALAAPQ